MLRCWMLISAVGPPSQNVQMVICSAVVYIYILLVVLVVSVCSTSIKGICGNTILKKIKENEKSVQLKGKIWKYNVQLKESLEKKE